MRNWRTTAPLAGRLGPIGVTLLIAGILGCFLGGVLMGLLFVISSAQRAAIVSLMVGSIGVGSVFALSGITTLYLASARRTRSGLRPKRYQGAQAWIPVLCVGCLGGIALLVYFGLAVGGERGLELGAGCFLIGFTTGGVASIQYQQALRPAIRFVFGWSPTRTRIVLVTLGLIFAMSNFALAAWTR